MTTTTKKAYLAPQIATIRFRYGTIMASSPQISINDNIEVDASTSYSNAKSWDSMNWTNHPADE